MSDKGWVSETRLMTDAVTMLSLEPNENVEPPDPDYRRV
jgi:hypothetical protein